MKGLVVVINLVVVIKEEICSDLFNKSSLTYNNFHYKINYFRKHVPQPLPKPQDVIHAHVSTHIVVDASSRAKLPESTC